MKSLIALLIILLQLSSYADNLQEFQSNGIELYKNKKNKEALIILTKALEIDKENGKTNYYLGNVYMNLFEYNKAIECYNNSWHSKYEINNSLFNIACAYSLLNKPKKVLSVLYMNYERGDRYLDRIKNDTDLNNFKNSKYFQYLFKSIELKDNNGIIPKTKDDFLKYLFSNGNICYPESGPMFMGKIIFHKDGFFNFFTGSGTIGTENAGIWEIDEKNNVFVIKDLGRIQYLGFEDVENKRLAKMYSDNGYYRNDSKYVWIEKYKNIKIEKIPFNKIRFEAVGLAAYINYEDDFYFYKYMMFDSKIIPKKIGKKISEKEFENKY